MSQEMAVQGKAEVAAGAVSGRKLAWASKAAVAYLRVALALDVDLDLALVPDRGFVTAFDLASLQANAA
jgi:hypothetical protein